MIGLWDSRLGAEMLESKESARLLSLQALRPPGFKPAKQYFPYRFYSRLNQHL